MVQQATVRQALDDLRTQFMDAFNRGDAASLAALYIQDGTLLAPNLPIITGRQGIQDFFAGARGAGMTGITLQALEVGHDGDLAYEIGTAVVDIQPSGGQPAKDVGKYVIVCKRQADGSWKMITDMFSSDAPPPGH